MRRHIFANTVGRICKLDLTLCLIKSASSTIDQGEPMLVEEGVMFEPITPSWERGPAGQKIPSLMFFLTPQ